MMDFLHTFGVLVIHHLQNNYSEFYRIFNFMSTVGDPRNIFLVYFPLLFHLSHNVGTKMIWATVVGDWLNLILKWTLFGQRPYWWVQESLLYQNSSKPHLDQFEATCETGPGSPSGHAMGSSCVWYVIVTSVMNFARPTCISSVRSFQRFRLLRSLMWTAFWVIQISVCLSRVFIATHFPHQVLLGLVVGMLVGEVFEHIPYIYNANLKTYLQVSIFLLCFAFCFYFLLNLLDFDPLWSVTKARKWCANPDWIHLDTTPFAGLWRNLGALFGLGLAVNSDMFVQSCKEKNNCKTVFVFKLMCMMANLTVLQLYNFLGLPTYNELLFNVVSFCKSASVLFGVVALIPYCVHVLIRNEEKKTASVHE